MIHIFLITAAVQKGSPVTVAMIRASGIVGSFLLQFIGCGAEPDPTIPSIVGAVVIGSAAVLSTFENTEKGDWMNKKLESCWSRIKLVCSKCSRKQNDEQVEADQSSNV